jgi:predicted PurR-regulated permease PerM
MTTQAAGIRLEVLGDSSQSLLTVQPITPPSWPNMLQLVLVMVGERARPLIGWLLIGLLVYAAGLTVKPFLAPLAWAAVLSIVFYPLFERLASRWSAGWSAATVTLMATLMVVAPLLVVCTLFVREAVQASSLVQSAFESRGADWMQAAVDVIHKRIPIVQRVDIAVLAGDAAHRLALFAAAQSGIAARNIGRFVLDLIIALFATFFLLRDSPILMHAVRRILPMDAESREALLSQIRQLVSVSVTASLLVAAVQGILGGVVFALVGIRAPVFWGVVMTFLCLLPLGAWLIWLPAAILLALDGEVGRAAIVATLGFGVVSAVDNVLRPALLSGGTQMNGLVILVALLGGISAFGVIGVVLGPIVLAATIALLKTYVAEQPA